VEAYNPVTDSWSSVTPMPTARGGLATAVGGDGRIYAVGGETNIGVKSDTAEAYNFATKAWSIVDPMPTARSRLGAAAGKDGRVYAIGGGPGALTTVEGYTPVAKVIFQQLSLVMPDKLPASLVVTDDRHWGIDVILNGHDLGTFHDIHSVEIHTGSGDDTIDYRVAGGVGSPADLLADLGTGADTFTLNALPAVQDQPSAKPWDIDVHTVAGRKDVSAKIDGLLPAVQMGVELGAGHNVVNLAFDHIEHSPAPSAVTLKGGPGDNDIHITYGFNPQPPALSEPNRESPITTTIDGGTGTNNIDVSYLFTCPADPSTVPLNIPLRTNVTGGGGGNDIRVIFACFPVVGTQSSLSSVQIDAPIEVNVLGGKHSDTILMEFLGQPTSDSPGTQLVLNSRFSMRLEGGDGGDRIEAGLFFASESRGVVDAEVRGGRGDDVLMLAILGIADPNLHAQIDGGEGFDVAVATRNVLVRNCEEILWL
jgi:hypothetical protein